MAYRLAVDELPETLGAIELTSIARGYSVVDQMIKRAPVQLLDAGAYCPGKFLIIVSGEVAAVEEALEAGERVAGAAFFGRLFIPNLSPSVIPAINRNPTPEPGETVGVIESFSAVSAIDAADAAVKSADVTIESVNLLEGIGGKAFVILSGELTDVSSALEAGRGRIPEDMIVETQVISQISREIIPFLPGRS
jgi:microcompartment protein CcmL/EutN